jgi:hypothetical protein
MNITKYKNISISALLIVYVAPALAMKNTQHGINQSKN